MGRLAPLKICHIFKITDVSGVEEGVQSLWLRCGKKELRTQGGVSGAA